MLTTNVRAAATHDDAAVIGVITLAFSTDPMARASRLCRDRRHPGGDVAIARPDAPAAAFRSYVGAGLDPAPQERFALRSAP